MSETAYSDERGSSLWGNIWDGAKTGAGAGALFGGVGAIPGAIGGAGLGFVKSIVNRVDENDDRAEFIARLQEEGGGDVATSADPDVARAREEVFYENREARRDNDGGMFSFFDNWVY
jgi:hypothetical protein